MKNLTTLFSVIALAACGGNKPAPAPIEPPPVEAPPPMVETPPAPEAVLPPAPPPAPPPPKVSKAKAELTPVKGQKFKAAVITISQKEGDSTSQVNGGFEGLKPGAYHLVVHTAADCGPNATKAGAAFPGAAAPVDFKADAGGSAIDVPAAPLQLEGEQAVTGRVLVLHGDKAGKVGKALACGPIMTAAE